MSKRCTVLMTIRGRSDVVNALRDEALRKGITVNNLVNSILSNYVEWDRFADAYRFVRVPLTQLKDLLEATDVESLIKLGRDAGRRQIQSVLLSNRGKVTFQAFLETTTRSSRHGCPFEFEYELDGNSCELRIHHDLGDKGTLFYGEYFAEATKAITGVTPRREDSGNSIVVTVDLHGVKM